jgi:hypothetical protein
MLDFQETLLSTVCFTNLVQGSEIISKFSLPKSMKHTVFITWLDVCPVVRREIKNLFCTNDDDLTKLISNKQNFLSFHQNFSNFNLQRSRHCSWPHTVLHHFERNWNESLEKANIEMNFVLAVKFSETKSDIAGSSLGLCYTRQQISFFIETERFVVAERTTALLPHAFSTCCCVFKVITSWFEQN